MLSGREVLEAGCYSDATMGGRGMPDGEEIYRAGRGVIAGRVHRAGERGLRFAGGFGGGHVDVERRGDW